MGYSGANVARFLGITTSAVNRLAVSDELPEVEKISLNRFGTNLPNGHRQGILMIAGICVVIIFQTSICSWNFKRPENKRLQNQSFNGIRLLRGCVSCTQVSHGSKVISQILSTFEYSQYPTTRYVVYHQYLTPMISDNGSAIIEVFQLFSCRFLHYNILILLAKVSDNTMLSFMILNDEIEKA